MAKLTFKTDPNKDKKKTPRPISETKLSKPAETYDPIKASQQVECDIQQEQKDNKLPKAVASHTRPSVCKRKQSRRSTPWKMPLD